VHAVAFGVGPLLVSGGNDGAVRIWNVDTGTPVGEPLQTNDAVQDVAVSPNGTLVAAAGAGAKIQLWETATRSLHGNPITGLASWINDIAFTPDRRTIASAADEGLQLWDIETGRARGARLQGTTRSLGVAISSDGFVVAAAGDQATTVWDLHPDRPITLACRIANRNLAQAEWERFPLTPDSSPRPPRYFNGRTCPIVKSARTVRIVKGSASPTLPSIGVSAGQGPDRCSRGMHMTL
jgi:WD40 repeat protein